MSSSNETKRIEVAATRSDYEPVIRAVEAQYDLKYVLRGLFESPDLTVMHSALEIENLGVSLKGKSILDNSYIIVDAKAEVTARDVPQRRGGTRYEVKFESLPAITFRPGRLFKNQCLIIGSFVTDWHEPFALDLMKSFRREVKKRFVCIKSCWLGPKALNLFNEGMRCTYSIDMPEIYNLKRD